MNKLWKVVQALLIAWGIFSLVAVLIWLLTFLRGGDVEMREGGPGRTDKMTMEAAKFMLRTEPLNTAKMERVVHSFESARAFTGDHMDAVAVKVTGLPVSEFEKLDQVLHASWVRGDKVDDVTKGALSIGRNRDWLPPNAEVLTEDYYINPGTIVLHDGHLTEAELLYVNLKTQMVYYINFKF
jgi:hypothetical protein